MKGLGKQIHSIGYLPGDASTHLPILEGWKAESALEKN